LRLMDLNHRKATIKVDNMDLSNYEEEAVYDAVWSKEYNYLMNQDLDDCYESQILREAKQQEKEARGQ